jgi:hypothetical protein
LHPLPPVSILEKLMTFSTNEFDLLDQSCKAVDSEPDFVAPRLPRLDPGPWISSGRILNYEGWEARDRFVELDRRIAANENRCEMIAA